MRAIFRAVAGLHCAAYALAWRASLRAVWAVWRALLGLSRLRAYSVAQYYGPCGLLLPVLSWAGAGRACLFSCIIAGHHAGLQANPNGPRFALA